MNTISEIDDIDNQSSEDELFEHFRMQADKGQEPLRVHKFLMNFITNATRNKIQQAAKAGNIVVNGQIVKQNYRVKANDIVTVVLAYPPRENIIIPENIPLNIVYEDDALLVVDKKAEMVVHPGHGNYTGTLINALTYHFQQQKNYHSDLDRVGLVHRIDKGTSGLLVIAKTEFVMNHLAKQFFNKTTKRLYNALVWGNIEQNDGTIIGNLARNPKNRMQMCVFEDETIGKPAVTHYSVLKRYNYVTFVECRLETGRTHQIRAHMKHIGHTLFNDERYEGNQILKGTTFTKYKQFIENCFETLPRQALHARTLGFIHPITNEELFFESPLPNDFKKCLDKWENYVESLNWQEKD